MDARAKMTSKGQLTVPVEVRRRLGLDTGDVVIFEVRGNYATMHKRRPTLEAVADIRENYPSPMERPISDHDAVAEYFDEEHELRLGPTLYVGRDDGGLGPFGESDSDSDRANR